jgi:hypothetical protein
MVQNKDRNFIYKEGMLRSVLINIGQRRVKKCVNQHRKNKRYLIFDGHLKCFKLICPI